MRTIDLESLLIFQTVVLEGGVNRAAGKLHRVPSNVTTRIRQLEAFLGVRLFRREGRTLALTAEGRTLLDYATRLLRLADEAVGELRSGKPQGYFRLGSLESTAGSRLAPILSRYHAGNPGVVVELVTGTTAALLQRVVNSDVEAAFVSEPFSAPELASLPVFREELVLIAPPGLKSIRGAGDLGGMTMIAFAHGCSYRKRLEDWLGSRNVASGRVLEFGSYQGMIACVAAGTGFAIVPRTVLATLDAAGKVSQHRLPARIADNRTHLVWRGEPSLALAGLIALLREQESGGEAHAAARLQAPSVADVTA
jgi:DNA-binding transcriptional LysR family regulator